MKYTLGYIGLVFVLLSPEVCAQRKTVTQLVEFNTINQGMWGPGNAPGINNTFEIFPEYTLDLPFDTRDATIFEFEGLEFGAGIDGFIKLGLGPFQFVIEGFELGSVDVNYPAEITIDVPDDGSFNAGETINLFSDFTARTGAEIITRYPSAANARVALELGMFFDMDLGFTACLVDCLPRISIFEVAGALGAPSPLIDRDFKFFEVTLSEMTFVCPDAPSFQCVEPGIGNPPSYSFTDSRNIFEASAELPFVETTSEIVGNRVLVARGEHAYVRNTVKVIPLIIAFELPVVSQVLRLVNSDLTLFTIQDFVGNDVSLTVTWVLLNVDLVVPITHKQEFIFNPQVRTTLDFDDTVGYVVKSAAGRDQVGRGTSFQYVVGDEVDIDFPCTYEFMDVVATHAIENEFSNKTNDNIALQIEFDALTFGVQIDPFIIIPEICIPIPFVGDQCVGPIGTPAINEEIGPLVPSEEIVLIEQDFPPYIDRTWELGGFRDTTLAPFRIQPRRQQVTFATTDVECHDDATGTITTTFPDASAPLQYEWSFGSTDQSPVNVLGGTHNVKITDANECVRFESVTIQQPEPLEADIFATNISCDGAAEADIMLDVTGGTGAYSYRWNIPGETSAGLVGRGAGTYTVEITDVNNCRIEKTITITEPGPLVVEIFNPQEPSCAGGGDGALDLFVGGGTPPYSFLWSNGQIGRSIDELPAGNYDVLVTDVNGCTIRDNIILDEPSELQANLVTTADVTCFSEANGGLSVFVQGGTPPYQYTWFNEDVTLGATNTAIDNLASGFYTVEVVDSKGCRIVMDRVINQPVAPLKATMTPTHVSCRETNDGAIDLTVEGGTPPYRYAWSNGAQSEDISNLMAGVYEVLVTDDNNCTVGSKTLVITPTEITPRIEVSNVSCQDQQDASIEVTAIEGGFGPYTVEWSTGATGRLVEGLAQGSYAVTIRDNTGCTYEEVFDISVNDVACLFIPSSFSPNGDDINDTWVIRNIELYPNVELRVFNRWGLDVFQDIGYSEPWDGTYRGNPLEPGTYYYVIDLNDGSPLYKGPLSLLQ